MKTEAKEYMPALEQASELISGFESPFGLELLSTVDWLIYMYDCERTVDAIKHGMEKWPAGEEWGQRKLNLFSDRDIGFALSSLEKLSYNS